MTNIARRKKGLYFREFSEREVPRTPLMGTSVNKSTLSEDSCPMATTGYT